MGVTATVPILPGAAVNQERSYASYPQTGAASDAVEEKLPTVHHSRHEFSSKKQVKADYLNNLFGHC